MCHKEDSSVMMLKAYLMQMFLSFIYEEKMTCRTYSREYLRYIKNLIRKAKRQDMVQNEQSEEISKRSKKDLDKEMSIYDIMSSSGSEAMYLENEYDQVLVLNV